MTTILYLPGKSTTAIPTSGFRMQPGSDQVAQDSMQAAELLGCAPVLVDVLASGSGYLVYSVFDCEGEVNLAGMAAVAEVTGLEFDPANKDEVLRGPVLVVTG